MGPTMNLFHFLFFLIIVEVFGELPSLPDHYELAEKYSCLNKVDIFFDRAVLFKYPNVLLNSWAGNSDFNCETSVISRTGNTGIISVIQKMNLRKSQGCIDFLKFGNVEEELCGEIFFGMEPISGLQLPQWPKFISDYSGPFSSLWNNAIRYDHPSFEGKDLLPIGATVELDQRLEFITHISSQQMPEVQNLDIIVAITDYKDCDEGKVPKGWFNCGYGVCILSLYVKDGIVNCPFGDCRDEGSCEEAMMLSPIMQEYRNETDQHEKNVTISNKLRRSVMTVNEDSKKEKEIEEVHSIGMEFKKHNDILERISKVMMDAVEILDNGKFVQNEFKVIHKHDSTTNNPEHS